MNRLSPLITRRAGTTAAAAAQPPSQWSREEAQGGGGLLDDAKLFATGWVGGLIFFGTFLG